jgi:hypothetical protein
MDKNKMIFPNVMRVAGMDWVNNTYGLDNEKQNSYNDN